jgi:hypothetical protein
MVTPNIESSEPILYDSTIRLSEILGKTVAEQDILISDRLKDVVNSNRIKTWGLVPMACMFTYTQ